MAIWTARMWNRFAAWIEVTVIICDHVYLCAARLCVVACISVCWCVLVCVGVCICACVSVHVYLCMRIFVSVSDHRVQV